MLRSGGEFIERAHAILAVERERLGPLLGEHHLTLVGGSSLPDALTKGDVDLHLRVPAEAFATTVTVLRSLHSAVHPEIWQASLATFEVEAALPTGIALTPIGSEHDVRFRRSWQLLAADPAALSAYNAMKRRAEGRPEAEALKSAFFDRLLARRPAGSPLDDRRDAPEGPPA